MRRVDRDALRALYQFRCGYCGTTEVDAGGELTVDHFQPGSRNGPDSHDNWVYACFACNDYKGDYWLPDSDHRILHPLQDDLAEHIRKLDDRVLIPLTETGRFHIRRLRLNRPQLILQRERNRQLESLRQRMIRLEEENAALLRRLQAAEDDIRSVLEEAEPGWEA